MMASVKQLSLVANMAMDKEKEAARMLKQANEAFMQNQQQLTQLNQYRLEYIRKMKARGIDGLHGNLYAQYQTFVGQVDSALIQQQSRLAQSKQAHEQRKQQWLEAQRYRQAIEKLIEREQQAEASRQAKLEQKQSDEFSMQQYYRRREAQARL